MSCAFEKSFSCKIILSNSVPSSRDGFDVIQLCAVIIGLPVSSAMLLCEAGLSILCTLGPVQTPNFSRAKFNLNLD